MILEVCWDGLWTPSFGLSQFHGHGSLLVCEVALSGSLVCNNPLSPSSPCVRLWHFRSWYFHQSAPTSKEIHDTATFNFPAHGQNTYELGSSVKKNGTLSFVHIAKLNFHLSNQATSTDEQECLRYVGVIWFTLIHVSIFNWLDSPHKICDEAPAKIMWKIRHLLI